MPPNRAWDIVMKKRFFDAIDFSKYKGRYVAIVRRKIVASGRDAEQVWHEAKRKHPYAQPEIMKVSKGETLVLLGRMDVFPRFDVAFREKVGLTSFSTSKEAEIERGIG